MRHRLEPVMFALVCLVITAGYFGITYPAIPQYGLLAADQQHFNQLVAGFRAGQLSLKQAPPAELMKLDDPYDPAQNGKYRLHDASYYRGKYYIYYGVTPALILFWPFVALTGKYLAQKYAVALFCSAGFLTAAGLVRQIRQRYFPSIGTAVLLAMVVAVGTVSGTSFLLCRPEMYEVSVSCAYAMVTAALAALWCCLGRPRSPLVWAALSGLFFGLAVAARPTFLFGAASLLILVACPSRRLTGSPVDRRYRWKLGLAAVTPLVAIGIGLAVYNYLRFGDPREFGIKYLLMANRVSSFFAFNWSYIWLNLKLYFFMPTRLMGYFPFVLGVDVPALPPGYAFVEDPFGVFANIPFLLLAGAAPLAWARITSDGEERLRRFTFAVGWVSLTSVLVLLGYVVASIRYEVDFTPYLAVLAAVGVFGIEEALSGRPRWRRLARLGWVGALLASIAFNFFANCEHVGLLERQAPATFQALSTFFNYPRYATHDLLASVRTRRGPDGTAFVSDKPQAYGPVLLKITLPASHASDREPLLGIGAAADSLVMVFIKAVGHDQVQVGFEFPGDRLYESRPITVGRQGPGEVAISCPALLPELGEAEWNGIPYRRQLSALGTFRISVNGVAALQVNSHLDAPIDRETPLSVGRDPVEDAHISRRFTGQILGVSRQEIGDQSLPE